jgi:hypothetical protein
MGKNMEKSFKRLSLALLALGLSAPAFADSAVVVPSQQGGFKIGIDALYLRATNSDLDYASSFTSPTANTVNSRNAAVDPSFDWGFYAQVGYLFPCTGNDITLSYTYLRNNDTDSVVAANAVGGFLPTVAVPPLSPLGLGLTGIFNAADGKAEFDLNAVDLDFGQRFTTGGYDMRMFAGLRYASINHTLTANAIGDIDLGPPIVVTTDRGAQRFTSDYRGIGPRIGVDGRYCLQSGFGLDANFSTALLVGNVDAKYDATSVVAGVTPNARYQANSGSRTRVVPVLEAKLGADYTHIVDRCSKSSLVFEAGYQVTNYFNAVDHARVVNGFTILSQNTTSDVAFDGPYLGVKYYA